MSPSLSSPSSSRTSTRAVVYIGVAFFSLFSGYTVFYTLLPALQPSNGAFIVALNYLAYAIGSLVTPLLVSPQRRRGAFALASLTYVAWMVSAQAPNHIVTWLGAVASAINGFGAGFLWATQGEWISQWCLFDQKRSAFLHGIFLFLYSMSGLLGNLAALAALLLHVRASSLQWALCVSSGVGCLLLLCAPHRWLHRHRVGDDEVEVEATCTTATTATTSSGGGNGDLAVDGVDGGDGAADESACQRSKDDDDLMGTHTHTHTASDADSIQPPFEVSGFLASQYRSRAIGPAVLAEVTAVQLASCEEEQKDGKANDGRPENLDVVPANLNRGHMWRLLSRNGHFMRCIGAIVSLSFASAFVWVAIPRAVGEPVVITGVFAVYAFAYGTASLVSTVLLRHCDPSVVFALVSITLVTPIYAYFAFAHDRVVTVVDAHTVPYIFGAVALFYGSAMNLFTTSLFTHYTSKLGRDEETDETSRSSRSSHVNLAPHAFCVHGVIYCLFYALASLLIGLLEIRHMAVLTCVVTWCGAVIFVASNGSCGWARLRCQPTCM